MAILLLCCVLGECCLEIGDEKNALEYLLWAYMFEGEKIFAPDDDGEDDGAKYFEFLRTHIDLGLDNDWAVLINGG